MSAATVSRGVCPVCDGTALARLPTPVDWVDREAFAAAADELGLARCRRCRFVFVEPRPADALLDAFYRARDYSAHGPADAAAASRRAAAQLAILDRFAAPPAGARLLDYGCGGGHLLEVARGRGFDVHGFDVGARSLAACRVKGLPVTDDAARLPRGFDVVVMSHVLEHVADHGEVLHRCGELLAPGGRLVVEVPNARSLRAVLSPSIATRRLGFDERYRAFPIHLSYFTPPTLRRVLARHGFEVRGMTTVGLGVDGLRSRPEPRERGDVHVDGAPVRRVSKSATRRVFEHTFFDLTLGENLVAVA